MCEVLHDGRFGLSDEQTTRTRKHLGFCHFLENGIGNRNGFMRSTQVFPVIRKERATCNMFVILVLHPSFASSTALFRDYDFRKGGTMSNKLKSSEFYQSSEVARNLATTSIRMCHKEGARFRSLLNGCDIYLRYHTFFYLTTTKLTDSMYHLGKEDLACTVFNVF